MNDLLVAGNLKEKTPNSDWIAPAAHLLNLFDIDESLRGLARRRAGTGGAVIA